MSVEGSEIVYPPLPCVTRNCILCGFMFSDNDSKTKYWTWCDECFLTAPLNMRHEVCTPEDLALSDEQQKKVRETLKQRAIDKKNRVGKTTISKRKKEDDELDTALIFNQE